MLDPVALETGLPEELPFGLETEYALNVYGPGGEPADREIGLRSLLQHGRRTLACLADGGAPGLYLENGARLYMDAGAHPEYSTPECAHPRDLVRQAAIGDHLVHALAGAAVAELPGGSVAVFRANVDYTSGATWGCHESYLHRGDPEHLSPLLIPHLASRIVYTGAGGFEHVNQRTRFVISPRVPHLTRSVSAHSTEQRGIFHTKDEPLCNGGFHRLHIICGESLCSQVATFVKLGATALVVRMIVADAIDRESVALRSGLTAMRAFIGDPTAKKQIILANGRRCSAVGLQRVYLETAEKHLGARFMPDYAEEVCREWRRLLDLLEEGPEAVATTLDWAIKYALFDDRAEKRGTPLSAIARNASLRDELFEIDTRFGQLGERGVFVQLDQAGALDHAIGDVGDIASSAIVPPDQGRARARGALVRELAGDLDRYLCSWDGVIDQNNARRFDLRDPFGRNTGWKPLESRSDDDPRFRERMRRHLERRRQRMRTEDIPF